ncbi:MAG: YihY/virulence factor BrkB family protein [Victivallales bacterium]
MSRNKKDLFGKLRKFFLNDVWTMEKDATPSFLRPFIVPIRVIYMIAHDFMEKKTLSTASSLSYTTVLGMIPLLIIAMTFSKGFLRDKAEEFIPRAIDSFVENVAPQLESVPAGDDGDKLKISAKGLAVKKLADLLIRLDAGKLGLYGIIPFLFIAYSMLRTIENAMNDIWNAKRGRPIWHQFLQYWLCLTLLPLVIFITMGLTGTQFVMLAKGINNSATYVVVKILPFITLWFGFAVFYKIVPNVQVRLYPAIVGGIVGGTLWQMNNNLSFIYVSKAVQMHTFFGGLAVIPIMLAALYFAWLIVLFGAHVAFAVQNIDLFRSRHLASDITPSYRQKIALACILMINDCFEKGKTPPDREDLSAKTGVPETFIEDVVPFLLQSKLIRENNEKDASYLPALPPEKVHIREVLESITGPVHQDIFLKPDSDYWRKAEKTCESFHNSCSRESNPPLISLL